MWLLPPVVKNVPLVKGSVPITYKTLPPLGVISTQLEDRFNVLRDTS